MTNVVNCFTKLFNVRTLSLGGCLVYTATSFIILKSARAFSLNPSEGGRQVTKRGRQTILLYLFDNITQEQEEQDQFGQGLYLYGYLVHPKQ